MLVRLALERGAIAASAFGAGSSGPTGSGSAVAQGMGSSALIGPCPCGSRGVTGARRWTSSVVRVPS